MVYLFSKIIVFIFAIALTPLGQKNYGGHTHNDKLSYELLIEGIDVIRDPGLISIRLYPHRRNEFRSVMAHNYPGCFALLPATRRMATRRLQSDASGLERKLATLSRAAGLRLCGRAGQQQPLTI